jgi:hypothetical protein
MGCLKQRIIIDQENREENCDQLDKRLTEILKRLEALKANQQVEADALARKENHAQ